MEGEREEGREGSVMPFWVMSRGKIWGKGERTYLGDLDVLESKVGGRGGTDAQLILLLPDGNAGSVTRDDEGGDT